MLVEEMSSSAFQGAVGWVLQFLIGSTATLTAGLSIAAVGLAMLGGRIPMKRGMIVIIGCFVIFSSQTIATSFQSLELGKSEISISPVKIQTYHVVNPSVLSVNRYNSYDPYAGDTAR